MMIREREKKKEQTAHIQTEIPDISSQFSKQLGEYMQRQQKKKKGIRRIVTKLWDLTFCTYDLELSQDK